LQNDRLLPTKCKMYNESIYHTLTNIHIKVYMPSFHVIFRGKQNIHFHQGN